MMQIQSVQSIGSARITRVEIFRRVGSLILHFVQNDITCSGISLNKPGLSEANVLRRPSIFSARERGW
jgi:hypothetical protein